jgi:UDP-glucose:(heptosyl)LPS alpha-1,3-glucosyltransferase
MLIAFTIFKYFPYGGIQRDMSRIAQQCIARGHRVRIYTLEWSGSATAEFEVIEVPVRALANHRRYQKFAAWVMRDLQRRPADVVVGMNKMPGLDVYFAGDPCYAERARAQRGWWYRWSPRFRAFAALEEAVFGRGHSAKIMTISDVQTPLFVRHYGTESARLHPLPPGIDRSRMAPPERAEIGSAFRSEFGVRDDERLLLFLGSGFITKGLDRALHGIAALPPALLGRTRLYVVGQDNPRQFASMARKLGIAERVRFFSGRDDVPRFLFGSDVLLLPAYSENTGTAILEAVVAGLPVLVTANCGYAHHVARADAGIVLPQPYAQASFDDALEVILSDDAARARWSVNGIAYGQAADLYSLHEHAVRIILDVAVQLRAGAPRAGPLPRQLAAGRQPVAAKPPRALAGSRQMYLREDLVPLVGARDPLAALLGVEGRVYRALANRCTLRFEWGGRGYFLKKHLGVGWREIAKNMASGKRPVVDASNEFAACERLRDAGVGTLTVAAFGSAGRNPARRRSLIVTDELCEHISLEDYCATWRERLPDRELRWRLIRAVAEIARAMHGAGVVHRDFYICHLLLDQVALAQGEIQLKVIDLHRARVRSRASEYWIKRDLAALLFSTLELQPSRSDQFRFVAAYTGQRPALALREQRTFWSSVQRRAERLQRKAQRKGISQGFYAAG